MKSKVRLFSFIMVLVVLVFAVGCKKEEPKEEITTENVVEIQTVDAFGVVKGKDTKNIMIDFKANVEDLPVGEGYQVSKGEVLAVLDIKDYLTIVDTKEHELAIARLQLEKLKNTIYKSQNDDPEIKILVNELSLAEENYKRSQKDYTDQETLYSEGAISKLELQGFKEQLELRAKELEDAQYALELKTQSKKSEAEELRIQTGRITILENELLVLKNKLNHSYLNENKVVADMENALVYDIGYVVGDSISPEKKLLSLMNLDSLNVEAEIPEEFIKDIKLGSEVLIIPIADKSKEYKGKVVHVASHAIQKNGETIIPVEIGIDNNDQFLRPNFNVDVSIPIGK